MAYPPFDATKPDATTQTLTAMGQSERDNIKALRDALAATGGVVQGFNFSKSGGTASQPAQLFWKRGAEWIRVDLTWGTTGGGDGNVIKAVYYYSSNSGGAYDPMADLSGNYVATRSFDAGGDIDTITWGATP